MYAWMYFSSASTIMKAAITAAAAVLTLVVTGCGTTEPDPLGSIAGDWTGSGGGLKLDVSFNPPRCDISCVADGSGSWSFDPAGESGTIDRINFFVPFQNFRTGDQVGISFVDLPGGPCFFLSATVVDERTLTGRIDQGCGSDLHVGDIDTEFTLKKL